MEKGAKQTSKIDMASVACDKRKKVNQQARRETRKKANKRWCPRGINVGLDRMSITSLCCSTNDTLARKTHA